MQKRITDNIVLGFGILMPFIINLLFPDLFHHYDYSVLKSWSQYKTPILELYNTGCRCEYPALGLILSAFFIKIFGGDVLSFKLYLSIYDAAIISLIYFLLRKAKVPRAGVWAGIIGIVPSSWAGTSLWAQVDNIGQFFTIAAIVIFYFFVQSQKQGYKTLLYIFFIGVFTSFMLQTKQLLVFPIVAIMIMFGISLFIQKASVSFKILEGAIAIVGFILPIVIIDSMLLFDDKYFSHLQRVLNVYGVDRHMNEVSANGFNVWIFLGKDYVDSMKPFWKSLTPKETGMALYIIYVFVISCYTIFSFLKHKVELNSKQVFFKLLFIIALVNIGFNVLMTGTHERYLLYFYPYIIIAMVGLQFHVKHIWYAVFMACVYGTFVLQILNRHFEYINHYITGSLHVVFFVYLNVLFFKQLQVKQNLAGNE